MFFVRGQPLTIGNMANPLQKNRGAVAFVTGTSAAMLLVVWYLYHHAKNNPEGFGFALMLAPIYLVVVLVLVMLATWNAITLSLKQ